MYHEGYVKLWRKTINSGLCQMPNTLALFIYLLMKATHKPIRNGMDQLAPGQFVSGRKALAKELKQSEREIRTSLERLVTLEILTIKTTNKYSIYTIVNYEKYQFEDLISTSKTTNKRPTSDQQATTKQEYKNVNTKEETPSVSHNKIVFDGKDFQNINGQLAVWESAYPAIDVNVELKKMAAWLVSHPANRKSNYGRFINGWLSRAQDKAPVKPSSQKETLEEFMKRMAS